MLRSIAARRLLGQRRIESKLSASHHTFHHEWSPGASFQSPEAAAEHERLTDYAKSLYKQHGFREVVTPSLLRLSVLQEFGVEEDDGWIKRHTKAEKPVFLRWTQDDAHVFCAPKHLENELSTFLDLCQTVYVDRLDMNIAIDVHATPEHISQVRDAFKALSWDPDQVHECGKTEANIYVLADNGQHFHASVFEIVTKVAETIDLHYYEVKTTPLVIHEAVFGPFESFLQLQKALGRKVWSEEA